MKYGALSIDTSVFDHYGLSLDAEPLKSLEQFKGKPVGLVLVDVVLLELQSHLIKRIDDQSKAIAKAGRVAKALNLDPSLVQNVEMAIASINPEELAVEKLDNFLDATGAKQIRSGDHVAVEQLLQRYFGAQPPFAASGQKKSEFPDAICLLALEAHAKANNIKMLVVSGDGDWRGFAAQSEWMDFESDLSAAIAHFHPQASAYNFCHDFIANWCTDKYNDLVAEIVSHVESAVEGFNFDVDANSALEWEIDDLTVRLENIELWESGDPEMDIKVINLGDDSVTFKVKAILTCLAEGDFSLSVYDSIDKDYTRIGTAAAKTRPEIEAEVFVRVSGNLEGPIPELEVDTVDVTPTGRLVADFGYIEPDWHEDDYG